MLKKITPPGDISIADFLSSDKKRLLFGSESYMLMFLLVFGNLGFLVAG